MSDDRNHPTPLPAAPADGTGAAAAPSTQLRTVALCDLVDSTALIERLGDRRAAELFRRHDRLARDLLYRHHGREIDKTDGFLALFERPIHAVAFALDYQRALRDLGAEERIALSARVGVHVGDVLLWSNEAADIAKGAKQVEVEGLAKPMAARLMHLARPGQILLSGMAHNLASRAQDELGPLAGRVRWPIHGRYRFKGLPSPLLVHEVGEVGIAPLQPPPSSSKAQRELPLWRRPRSLAVEVLVALAAVLALVFVFASRPEPAIAFGERDWVVVGDLRNLTGDASVDDALETAFRISLEQSRFVNVMPELALRQALERMQQPGSVAVDRAVGSEIAVREGARALILPTVADVGGRIRVSAEIVDPHTQTTVYAEAADGLGLESSLGSMDAVTGRLRLSLGETLQSIERDTQPLPRVTSANLEALKAYAAGEQKMFAGEMDASRGLFRKALEIDPGFALAHVGAARTAYAEGGFSEARHHVAEAARLAERLTARDALYVEAWNTTLAHPGQGLERWRLLTSLYPDYQAGHFNAALIGWQYANRYEEGIPFVRAILERESQGQGQGASHYLLGILETGANRPEAALASFGQASKLGLRGQGVVALGAHLSAGDVASAQRVLEAVTAGNGEASNVALARVAFGAATGDFASARRAAQDGMSSLEAPWTGVLEAHEAQLAWVEGAPAAARLARSTIEGMLGRLAAPGAEQVEVCAALLTVAHVGVLLGEAGASGRALEACGPVVESAGYDLLVQVRNAVAAQHGAQQGDAAAALARLGDVTAQSPVLVHAIRMQLAADAGRWDLAREEADWLARNRGRAHAEFLYQWIALPAAVAWTRAAPLWQVESMLVQQQPAQAREALGQLLGESPWLATSGPFAARVAALRERAGSLEDVGDE